LTLLLANWRYVVMALLVAMVGLQTMRLRGAQADVRAVRVELAQAEARISVLGDQIERQNAAVNDWQTKAEQAAQAGRRAREQAAKVSMHHQASAVALAAAVAAPAAGLTCGDAVGVVRADLAAQ
jgi:phage shock protein A